MKSFGNFLYLLSNCFLLFMWNVGLYRNEYNEYQAAFLSAGVWWTFQLILKWVHKENA